MIIYCTGCSHSEGSGLADQDIFPDEYPGEIEMNKVEGVKWTNKRTLLLAQNPFLLEKLRQENLKKAWPSKLASMTNSNVINASFGGAGIEALSMTLFYDLDILVKENKKPDLIILALPGLERVPLINRWPISGYHPLAFKNVMPAFVDSVPENYKNYCEGFFTSHSNEEILTFYLHQCLTIKTVSNLIIGKDPIFLNIFGIAKWKSIVDESNIYLLKQYWKMLDFDKLVETKPMVSFMDDDKIMLPDGHFKEEVHERFARYIKDTFIND